MKKRIILLVAAVLLLALCLTGCSRLHRIHTPKGTDLITSCPKFARTGDWVEVETVSVTDGWLEISGVNGDFENENLYVFIMPDDDVYLKVWVQSNGLA